MERNNFLNLKGKLKFPESDLINNKGNSGWDQQREVVGEVTQFGSRYHHGLEAGSNAELIAALAMLKDPEACLICNGYKDEEFVDPGLYACKMGYKCFFVIEMPGELTLIPERPEILNISPARHQNQTVINRRRTLDRIMRR